MLACALAASTVAGGSAVAAAAAPAAPGGPVGQLFDLVNNERAVAGLAPLAWRNDVAQIADVWSAAMAVTGVLAHNDGYFTDLTRSLLGSLVRAENVATASSIESAHVNLMNSPPHRTNILDPRLTEAGFGAVQDAGGRWWVTENFLRSSGSPAPATAPAPAPSPPPAPAAAPTPAPPAPPATPTPTTVAPTPPTTAPAEPTSTSTTAPEPARAVVAAGGPAVLSATPGSELATSRPSALSPFVVAVAFAMWMLAAGGHLVTRVGDVRRILGRI